MTRLIPSQSAHSRSSNPSGSGLALTAALTAAMLAVLVLPGFLQAQEPPPEPAPTTTPAAQVVEKLHPRDEIMLAFRNLLPNSASRDLADRLANEYPEAWAQFDAEYAALLSETFTEKQLQELLTFLSSETGQLWIQSSANLTEQIQSGSSNPGSLTFRMAAVGCAVGVLAPGDIEITDATYEATRSSREAAIATCDCVLTKAVEKWPSVPIAQQLLKAEAQSYIGELLADGVCPLPVGE
ncbi:MAG: DUF2059 domain-containing protein [Thermoanaerobaculia bacterium]|nr:DUF2059 domain-containing protein [Thermoanaerobaculia bacterium]